MSNKSEARTIRLNDADVLDEFIARIEYESIECRQAEKWEIYDAIVETARQNQEEVIARIRGDYESSASHSDDSN